MRKLLRCSVIVGVVALLAGGIAGHAKEVLSAYPQLAHGRVDAVQWQFEMPPLISLPLPVPESRQNLRLDCVKIGQAQRRLKDARLYGAQIIPAAPAGLTGAPPGRDELYHISRNDERFADLAQQFQCGRR